MNSKPINLLKSEYKLLGKIGSGGFSFVYLVESIKNSGELFAAKFQVETRSVIFVEPVSPILQMFQFLKNFFSNSFSVHN